MRPRASCGSRTVAALVPHAGSVGCGMPNRLRFLNQALILCAWCFAINAMPRSLDCCCEVFHRCLLSIVGDARAPIAPRLFPTIGGVSLLSITTTPLSANGQYLHFFTQKQLSDPQTLSGVCWLFLSPLCGPFKPLSTRIGMFRVSFNR
jgi:hypothetical protein